MTVLAALKKNDGIPSLNGWPLCAELMLLQLQHQIIHANRKWEADGRWSLGEEESIVCETVSHAQGHTHNHTQTDTRVCWFCLQRLYNKARWGRSSVCENSYCGPGTTCFRVRGFSWGDSGLTCNEAWSPGGGFAILYTGQSITSKSRFNTTISLL